MRVATVSDIHANLPALDAVLEDMPDVDKILFCGDLVGYYCWPNEVTARVEEHGVIGVRGNHDEAIIQGSLFGFGGVAGTALQWNNDRLTSATRTYLENQPYSQREELAGCDVYMVHGSPRSPVEEYVYPEQVTPAFFREQGMTTAPDVLLLGHTHVPFAEHAGDTLVVNPGSVGQPRDGDPDASYAVIDTDNLAVEHHRVSYDIDRVARRVSEEGLPEVLAQRLYNGR